MVQIMEPSNRNWQSIKSFKMKEFDLMKKEKRPDARFNWMNKIQSLLSTKIKDIFESSGY